MGAFNIVGTTASGWLSDRYDNRLLLMGYFPRVRIMLLFPPIPLPAWAFVTLYALLEMFLGVTGNQAGVAHFAHLGGMLGAAVVILFWRATDGVAKR